MAACVSRQWSQSVMPSGHLRQRGRDIERGGDFRRRRHHQQPDIAGQAVADLRQQVGVADQDLGAAVGQDVGDLLGLQMPVDRHDRAAQRRRAARDFEERKIVAQHHADRRAAAEAERPESRRRPRDAGVDFGIADLAFAADDRCHVSSLARACRPSGRPEFRRSRPSSCRRSDAAAIAGTADNPRHRSIP